jgi:hypothetical protein
MPGVKEQLNCGFASRSVNDAQLACRSVAYIVLGAAGLAGGYQSGR